MTTPLQIAPFLPQQRNFPNDNTQALTVEIDRAYVDIATSINARTIGVFPVNFSVATGEQWFISGQSKKQQTLRQVYAISGNGAVAHGIKVAQISGFTRIYGTFSDGTNWYPLPYVNPTAANQIGISISSTQIIFASGVGAPSIVSGYIILEYLSLV